MCVLDLVSRICFIGVLMFSVVLCCCSSWCNVGSLSGLV